MFYVSLVSAACSGARGDDLQVFSGDARHTVRSEVVRRPKPLQIAAQGGNKSLIHIDWMIGTGEVDIDGIKPDGSRVAVFRKGEWA